MSKIFLYSDSDTPVNDDSTTKLGRKRKSVNKKRRPKRFRSDEILRKCKDILLNNVFIFINEKIKTVSNNNIGYGFIKKQLLKLDKKNMEY